MLRPRLTLAYSTEDQAAANRLEGKLSEPLELTPLPVDRGNRGELLADMLVDVRSPPVILISDALLTNPNCVEGLAARLQDKDAPPHLPLLLADQPDLRERVDRRSAPAYYIGYWQDRYIDLRRSAATLGAEHPEDFEAYLRRIRNITLEIEELLQVLYRTGFVHEPVADAADWQPLLNFAQRAATRESHDKAASQADRSGDPQLSDRIWSLVDEGQSDRALTELGQVLEKYPDRLDLHYQYALLLAQPASPEAAGRALDKLAELLERVPHHREGLFLAGELACATDRYESARAYWEKLSDIQPYHPELNQRLGSLLADHFPADAREAAAYLRRAVKHEDVRSVAVLLRYARLLDDPLGKPRKAIKILRKATELDPTHAAAHYELAVRQYARGKEKHARKNFLIAASHEPAYDSQHNRRAFAAPAPARIETNEPEAAPQTTVSPSRPDRKIALISGASSGIGRATARRLARAGNYDLLLTGRRAERLHELASDLRAAHHIRTYCLSFDLSDRTATADAIAELPHDWRNIDVLINNAGKAKGLRPIQEGDLDHWDEMIDVNLRGLLYLTRAVTPGMVERGGGMVLNVASTAGKEVYPGGNVYCATKHAVDALTYAMRIDLVRHGIRVGQICPAHVEETEFAVVRFDGDRERANIYGDFQPLRSPDVAEAIYFMLSQPPHVNILDMVLQGTQQASSTVVDRSGRERFKPES